MSDQPAVTQFRCDDVALFSELFPGWDHEALQFSAGRFGFLETAIMLPGLRLCWIRHGCIMRIREFYTANVICIVIPLAGEGYIRWKGEELDKRSLLIQRPNEEHDFSAGGACRALYLQIDPSLGHLPASRLTGGNFVRPPSGDVDQFVRLCRQVSDLPSSSKIDPADLLMHRDRILVALTGLLERNTHHRAEASAAGGHASRHYVTYQQALDFASRNCDPISVREIAAGLGVSERGLHRAFVNWVGVPPSRYFEVQRLHDLRRDILLVNGGSSRISDLAARFGFSNPGRMAHRYSDLFREAPGETARRARSARN